MGLYRLVGVWRRKCHKDAAWVATSPPWRLCEFPCVRGRCRGSRPCLWLCRSHICPSAADTTGDSNLRDQDFVRPSPSPPAPPTLTPVLLFANLLLQSTSQLSYLGLLKLLRTINLPTLIAPLLQLIHQMKNHPPSNNHSQPLLLGTPQGLLLQNSSGFLAVLLEHLSLS